MNETVLTPRGARPEAGLSLWGDTAEDVVAELCSALFDSLRRSDQRRKAEQYLRGLMSAEGRKSMRNIAALAGSQAAEQSLHHFITSSTWDWLSVRQAFARYLERTWPAQAWVVQSLPIPKAGRHSVGVERRFVRELGQMMNAQQAYGVWFASDELSVPVNWRLLLPDAWVNDRARRRRVEIPECAVFETPEQSAGTVVLRVREWGLGPRPVVADARATGFRGLARELAQAGVPLLARVVGTGRLEVAERALPGYGAGPLPAQQILESVKALRKPARWIEPSGGLRESLVVGVGVTLPRAPARALIPWRAAGGPVLRLFGEWPDPHGPLDRVWLTDLTATPLGPLVRMARLLDRVDHDFDRIGAQVGLMDFTGRTYNGWHRHMTLASVAHAASLLTDAR